MKKLISLLMALALCLSLVACSGSGVDSAMEEADKLLESGDYAGALEVLVAADEYSRLNEKINAIRLAQVQETAGFSIVGTWKDLNGYYTITFGDDFTGTWVTSENQLSMDYELTVDGKIYITYPSGMKLNMVQEDGINKLVNEAGTTTLVPEADYAKFLPDVIELTMENYQEYFELRDAVRLYTNDFGEISSYSVGYGLFLKEEYKDRLEGLENVSFEVEADRRFYEVILDEATGTYTLGNSYDDINWDWYGGNHSTYSASVDDHRYWNEDPRNTAYQQICGIVSDGMRTSDYSGNEYEVILENVNVTRVQGTIELSK